MAVIPDFQRHGAVLAGKPNEKLRRIGVLLNIVEGFLNNAVNGDMNSIGQARLLYASHAIDVNLGKPVCELLAKQIDGCADTEFIDDGRRQVPCHLPQLSQRLAKLVDKWFEAGNIKAGVLLLECCKLRFDAEFEYAEFEREIEEFLFTHPKISEVQVFGVPDPKMGEEVCAWIQLRKGETATEEEIRDYCKRQISHFKIPRYVRFVDEYPMTVTGKIRKIEMSAMMAEELQGAA